MHLSAADLSLEGGSQTNVGTYTVDWSEAGKTALKNLDGNSGNNYNWTITRDATYKIDQATASASLGGSNSKTYDGGRVTTAEVNNGGSIKVSLTYPSTTATSTYTLQDGDYTWNTDDGNAPRDQGDYTITLTSAGVNHVKDAVIRAAGNGQGGTHNVTIANDAVTGSARFTINQKVATATLGGNSEKTYDVQKASVTLPTLTANWTSTGFEADEPLDLSGLTLDDFDWYNGTSDLGKVSESTVAPKDVGTYTIKLNSNGIIAIKNKNTNYSFSTNAIGGSYTYTINQADASAELSGSNNKTYNGQATTTAEVNSNGSIKVSLTYPGSTATSTYTLQDGDYTWNTGDGNAPSDQGNYTITLTSAGITHVKEAVIRAAGNGQGGTHNVTITNDAVTGSAAFVINQKVATATLGGNSEKVYDSQVADVSINTLTDNHNWTTTGFVSNMPLNLSSLTLSDFDWYQGNTKLSAAPTDAGDYTIRLNSDGLTAIVNANRNYSFAANAITGTYSYHIAKAAAQVAISGTQTSTQTNIDLSSFSGKVNEYTGHSSVTGNPASQVAISLSVSDLTYVDNEGNPASVPTHPGDYSIGLTDTTLTRLQSDPAYKNYTISRGPVGTFHLQGTINYIFQDSDENNRQVGSTIVKTGLPSEGVKNTDLVVPAGYNLVNGQTLPNTYSIKTTDPLTQNVVIKLKHATITVNPGQEAPTGPVPGDPSKNYEAMNNLTSTPTRTIKMTYPDGSHGQLVQKVSFSRTATFDEVTGKAAYSDWTLTQSDTGEPVWWAYAALIFDGYQASPTLILPVEVTGDTPDRTVTITYTAVSQPTQPTQPSRPVDPFNPNPINPITLVEPNDNPVSPISPVEPNVPNNTVSPTNPVEPTEPLNKQIDVIYQDNGQEIARKPYQIGDGTINKVDLINFVQKNTPRNYRITEDLNARNFSSNDGDIIIRVAPITHQKLVLYIGRHGRIVKKAYITVKKDFDSLAELTELAVAKDKMPEGYSASGKVKRVANHLDVWVTKKIQPRFNKAPKTKDVLYVAIDGTIVKKTRITGKVNKKSAQSKLPKGYKIAGIDRVNNHYDIWIENK